MKKLFLVFLILVNISNPLLAQKSKLTPDKFIEDITKTNTGLIIEFKLNATNEYLSSYPKTYIYYLNEPQYFNKYCGKKFTKAYAGNNAKISENGCNDNWQALFDFINDYWSIMKTEKILKDEIKLLNGNNQISSPSKFDIVEIIIHQNNQFEKITMRRDYFEAKWNRNYKTNILTKSFLFLSLIEKYNTEIDQNYD